jgi:hypothetical protein
MPSFAYEFLGLLGVPQQRILFDVRRPTIFRSAMLTTMVWHLEITSHRGVFFALRDAILSAEHSQEPSLGDRLWVLRGRQFAQRRDVLNAEELQGLLERYGFTCIDMSELPVRRKIAAVQSAKVLGGPHGGGLALSMFLKDRSTVIECFSPHHINKCFTGICHNLNHKYHQIVSRNTVVTQRPYGVHSAIDCDHLQLVLQNLEPSLFPVRPTASRPDPRSREAYEAALLAHADRIAPELAGIDNRIESAERNCQRDALRILSTMRLILASGLFDPGHYLAAYADIRDSGADPLEHYVAFGDRENRKPHPYFDPFFYRAANPSVPPDRNALEHYIQEGERAGLMPNWNFDPRAYLAANPELSDFVDRPLFHYLRIGKPAGLGYGA